MGVSAFPGEEPGGGAALGFGLKCNDCFALENISLARDTPLLRLFFSVLGFEASLALRSSPLPEPPIVESFVEAAGAGPRGSFTAGPSFTATSSSFPGEVPNMRFSKPPLLEKLRRLLPARLKDSRQRSVTGWKIFQPALRGDFDEVGELDAYKCDVNDLRRILDISASSPQANGHTQGRAKRGKWNASVRRNV